MPGLLFPFLGSEFAKWISSAELSQDEIQPHPA